MTRPIVVSTGCITGLPPVFAGVILEGGAAATLVVIFLLGFGAPVRSAAAVFSLGEAVLQADKPPRKKAKIKIHVRMRQNKEDRACHVKHPGSAAPIFLSRFFGSPTLKGSISRDDNYSKPRQNRGF